MEPTVSAQDLQRITESAELAEAANRVALQEMWDARRRIKRLETSLAVVLGALVEVEDEASTYLIHRVAQELRRLAAAPACAAELLGCVEEDVDTPTLNEIASHLTGSRPQPGLSSATHVATMH